MTGYKDRPYPTPDELLAAHQTLDALAMALPHDEVIDVAGSPAWDGIVEGKRMLAVATAYLSQVEDEGYRKAWDAMVEG